MLQAPVNGKCVKLVSSTRLLGLKAAFILYPVWRKTNFAFDKSSYHIKNIAEKLIPKVRRELGLVKGKCHVCYVSIYGLYDENKLPKMFSLRTNFHTSEECQENPIIDRMDLLLQKEIMVQYGQEYMTLTISAAPSDEDNNDFMEARDKYIMTQNLCPTPELLDLQQFSGCPSVSLKYETYANLMQQTNEMSQKREINSLFNITTMGSNIAPHVQNFSARVCLEAYLSILPNKNLGVSFPPIKIMLVVTAVMYNI